MVYGASKSISELLKNVDYEFDIILPKSISDKLNEKEIRSFYGSKVGKIYRYWLPYKRVFLGRDNLNITKLDTYKYLIREIISYFNIPLIHMLASKERYDFVYLNSITLYPLISKKNIPL
jgi:hypothetical protein